MFFYSVSIDGRALLIRIDYVSIVSDLKDMLDIYERGDGFG